MNTFGDTKSKTSFKNILGGMGFFEDDFEKESTGSSFVSQVTSSVSEAVIGLGQTITSTESKTPYTASSTEVKGTDKFSVNGSIEFNQKQQTQTEQLLKQKTEADRKRIFFQTLKEDQNKAEREKDRVFEEELNDIVSNLPTEQKNRLLHYQTSYKDKSIYQRAELRKKLIEQQKQSEKQEKAASIPSPAKQPSAMEGAFEGRSGNQGSGQANLSAQAVG